MEDMDNNSFTSIATLRAVRKADADAEKKAQEEAAAAAAKKAAALAQPKNTTTPVVQQKLQDKALISIEEQEEIESPTVTNENRPDTEVRTTNDLFHNADNSQHDRSTEHMGEWHKNYEDTYNQGLHNTGKTNAPTDARPTW
jgi:hypothetical protein